MKKLINVAKEFSPSIIALVMAVPAFAFAQLSAPPSGGGVTPVSVPQGNISSLSGVLQLLCNVFGWAFYFLIVLAVIFVLYAAFKYLTAAGEPEKGKRSRVGLALCGNRRWRCAFGKSSPARRGKLPWRRHRGFLLIAKSSLEKFKKPRKGFFGFAQKI